MSEERGDGEGADSQALSDTLRYIIVICNINLAGLAIGLVALLVWTDVPVCMCMCERGAWGRGGSSEDAGSQALSDTLRYINLAGSAMGRMLAQPSGRGATKCYTQKHKYQLCQRRPGSSDATSIQSRHISLKYF